MEPQIEDETRGRLKQRSFFECGFVLYGAQPVISTMENMCLLDHRGQDSLQATCEVGEPVHGVTDDPELPVPCHKGGKDVVTTVAACKSSDRQCLMLLVASSPGSLVLVAASQLLS